MTTYEHAVRLYQLGLSLIPIRPDTKIPAVKWKRYQSERCTPRDLRYWFKDCGFVIGIVTGAVSGIVAVDCDDDEAASAVFGYTCFGAVRVSRMRQKTRRGLHLIYRHPGADTRNTVRCLGTRVDVRGDGGYIRAYPDSFDWQESDLANAPKYQALPKVPMECKA